jgi:hypothetical protein
VTIFGWLRALVYLRQCARSLTRIATAQDTLAQIATDEWATRHAKPRPAPAQFGRLDIREANARWNRKREVEAQGYDPTGADWQEL